MEQQQSVRDNPLAFESTGRLIAKYSVPSVIAMLVSSLYNIVDQIFIGQGVGMLGNAATNVAFPFVNICIALSLLIGIGGASNFNLNMGRGENEKAKSFAGTSISLLILSGLALSIFSLLFLKPILIAFGSTKQVFPYALTYTRITALGFPFLIATNGFCNLIRSDGSPRYSMVVMVTGAVINTCLDPLFIFGFHWGIAGGAAATVIGQIVSCVMAAAYLTRFRTMKLTKDCLKINADNLKAIVSIGIASFFNQIAMMAVQIALNNTLAYYGALSSYGSDIPLACAGVIIKVNAFVMAFAIGIAQGCQPILGFNYGAQLYGRVRDTLKKEIITVTAIFSADSETDRQYFREGKRGLFSLCRALFPHLSFYGFYKRTPAYCVQLFQFHRKSLERDFLIPHQADTVFAPSDPAASYIFRNRWSHVCRSHRGRDCRRHRLFPWPS